MTRTAVGVVTITDVIDGEPGQRGSNHFYGTVTDGAWSDTAANNVITGEGHTKVLYDKVTLSDEANGFSETRYWNASWIKIDEVIDGNLIVGGTLTVGGTVLTEGNTLNSNTTKSDVGLSNVDNTSDDTLLSYARKEATAESGNLVVGTFTSDTSSADQWSSGTYVDWATAGVTPLPGYDGALRQSVRDVVYNHNYLIPAKAGEIIYFSAWVNTKNLSFRNGDTSPRVAMGFNQYNGTLGLSSWAFDNSQLNVTCVEMNAEWTYLQGSRKVTHSSATAIRPYLHIDAWHNESEPKIQGQVFWQEVRFSKTPHANGVNIADKTAGTVAGWNIDGEHIWSGTKQESDDFSSSGITLDKDGAIRAPKFRIDTDGDAYFKGDITGASGTFSGTVRVGTTDLTSANTLNSNQSWGDVDGRPLTLLVRSHMLNQTNGTSSQLGVRYNDGTLIHAGSRGISVVVVDKATHVIDSSTTYDTYIGATSVADITAALNALGEDKLVIIYTYDEAANMVDGNAAFYDAMVRCGATEEALKHAFAGRGVTTRGTWLAYSLIGTPSHGAGSGYEQTAWDVSSGNRGHADNWVESSVTLDPLGNIIAVGGGRYESTAINKQDKTEGSVGGWTVDSDAIYSGDSKTASGSFSTDGNLTLNADGSIISDDFRIDADGSAHFKGTINIGGSEFSSSTGMSADDVGADPAGSAAAAESNAKAYAVPVVEDYSTYLGSAIPTGKDVTAAVRINGPRSPGNRYLIAEWEHNGAWNGASFRGKVATGPVNRWNDVAEVYLSITTNGTADSYSVNYVGTGDSLPLDRLKMYHEHVDGKTYMRLYADLASHVIGILMTGTWYCGAGAMKLWQGGDAKGATYSYPGTRKVHELNPHAASLADAAQAAAESTAASDATAKANTAESNAKNHADTQADIAVLNKNMLEDPMFTKPFQSGFPHGFNATSGNIPSANVNYTSRGNGDPSWGLKYEGYTGDMNQAGPVSGDSSYYRDLLSRKIPVISGQKYGCSVYTGAHRCYTQSFIYWYDKDDAIISNSAIQNHSRNDFEAVGGVDLSGYKRIYSYGTAPSTAAYARMVIRKQDTLQGQSSSFVFYVLPHFGRWGASQTEPVAWEGAAAKETDKIDGSVGGWNIDSSYIWTGTKKTSNGYTTGGVTLSAGGALRAPKFRLDTDGNAHFLGDITGSTITGATLNGTQITGGTVQTATTGKRVVLTSSDDLLTLYNQDNEAVFGTDVDSSGNVELFFKGKLRNNTIDDSQFFTSAGISHLRGRLGMIEPSTPTGGTISYGTSSSMTGDFQITGSGDANRIFSGGNVMTMSLQAGGSYTYPSLSGDHTSATTPQFTVQFYKRTSSDGTTWGSWVAEGALKTITGYKSSRYIDFGGEPGYTNRWNITVGCSINVSEPVGTVDGTYYQVRAVVAQTAGRDEIDSSINSSLSSFIADEPANGSIAAHRHNWSDLDGTPIDDTSTYRQYLGKNSSSSDWVRTTANGIIPHTSGGASSLGTSSWPFNSIYGTDIYDSGVLLENKYAALSHSHAWSNITDKPSTFTPSTHNHTSLTDITSLTFGPGAASNDGAHIEWLGASNAGYLRISTWDDNGSEYIQFGDYDTSAKTSTFTQWLKMYRGQAQFTGNVSASTFTGALSGNASTASKWTTARTHTVNLTGEVTGAASQSVDGTGNRTWNISTTIAAPASPSITSTQVIGETIELIFTPSSTSNVDSYEVWSDSATGIFSLIANIPPQDFGSSMSVIDNTFEVGTVNYRVYAIKGGNYSTPATTSRAFSAPTLDVTNLAVIPTVQTFEVGYDIPDSRFVDHVEIYVDIEAVQANLSRTGATLVYSGLRDNFTYNVSAANKDNYHQFWVEVAQ